MNWRAQILFCDSMRVYRVATKGVFREPWSAFVAVDQVDEMLADIPLAVRPLLELALDKALRAPHSTVDVSPLDVVH